ncbi:MAG TPA: lysophospholipid acyltransferase family protein [Thermoanaerobaculia bacterium]|jgi:1-acyl-sn-glycerol-3-phosphate acyltransferase|nr:lysophospholipid acyltransferase family protein [Thermoanaerobaculia bacterium]
MFRTIWAVIVAIVVTIPLAITVMIIALISSSSPWIDSVIRLWGRLMLWGAGIRIRGDGVERIDRARRYILIANHHSYFDIPCIFAAIPQPIRFMAKKSLFSIPIFGWAIGRAGFIPIDRKNRRTAVKSFDLAVDRIRKGNTIVIFPEEGRSHAPAMRPFQRGAFLLAIRSELPILPLAIDGTYEAFKVGARRITPGVVTVRVGTPIETVGLSVRAKDTLLDQSRAQIEALLGLPHQP